MRDIRDDLIERIESLKKQREHAEMRVAVLEQQEAVLKAMLQQEEQRLASVSQASRAQSLFPPEDTNGKYTSPLARFVLAAFERKPRWYLYELREAAIKEGIDFGEKNPGRALHFLLVGMQQNGKVERQKDGSWRLME